MFYYRIERFLLFSFVKLSNYCYQLVIFIAIKLPNQFNRVIRDLNPIKGHIVDKAYFDEREFHMNNGLEGLRDYLKLKQGDTVCDGFCKINFKDMGSKNILLEGKNTSGETEFRGAINQLDLTAKRIYDKHRLIPHYAIITEIRLPTNMFEAVRYRDTSLKFVRAKTGAKNPFNIEYPNIFSCPILIGKS